MTPLSPVPRRRCRGRRPPSPRCICPPDRRTSSPRRSDRLCRSCRRATCRRRGRRSAPAPSRESRARRCRRTRAFARRIDAVHLAFVSRADEERPVASGHDGPDKRRRRFVDQLDRRPERELAASVDGQVVDLALQEVGLRRGLKELGRGRVQDGASERGGSTQRQEKRERL